jgi:hypothetical protein
MSRPEDLAAEIYERLREIARFVRSVLHYRFPDLDSLDPDLTVIAKICDLNVALLKSEMRKGSSCGRELDLAKQLTEVMRDISNGVINREDKVLTDAMVELDEFFRINK